MKTMRHPIRILDALDRSVWYITPTKAEQITSAIEGITSGRVSLEVARDEPDPVTEDVAVPEGVALIPVHGTIAYRMNFFSYFSGGTSTRLLANQVRAALADDAISRIVLEIDSPGGEASGIKELADLLYASRSVKEIIAIAEPQACSAAHFIASACTRFYAASTHLVGSIGAVLMHREVTERDARDGVRYNIIASTPGKSWGSEHEQLSDDARAYFQSIVNRSHGVFVRSLAQYRGIKEETVSDLWANGQVFDGLQAGELGMVDGHATLSDVLSESAPKTVVVVTKEGRMADGNDNKDNAGLIAALEASNREKEEQLATARAELAKRDVAIALNEAGPRINDANREAMTKLAEKDIELFKQLMAVTPMPPAAAIKDAPTGHMEVARTDDENAPAEVYGMPIEGAARDTELALRALALSQSQKIPFADAARLAVREA